MRWLKKTTTVTGSDLVLDILPVPNGQYYKANSCLNLIPWPFLVILGYSKSKNPSSASKSWIGKTSTDPECT